MIDARKFIRGYKADPRRCSVELREALRRGAAGETGGLQMTDFSLRGLAEACLGYQTVNDLMDPRKPVNERQFREAEEAVDSTGFSNITGQLIVNRVMQAFQNEEFVASRLVTTIPTRLNGEKIPGITKISDPTGDNADNLTVPEGMPYPHFGFGEDYVETPATTKRGLIVPVTREAIFFDRTGLVAMRAGEVGEVLGINKEKRVLDVVAGLSNIYSWKGTTYQTYYSATDSGNWTNHLDGNELLDDTSIDQAELLFADMLDPNTSEPVTLSPRRILFVTPHNAWVAAKILSASEVRATSNTVNVTLSPNPLARLGIQLEVSRQLYRRMIAGGVAAANAKETWFYGDMAGAFAYMENWPITVTQSGLNSEAAFNQDIVLRFKASERGAAAVLEPRRITRHRKVATSSSSGS